MNDSGRAVFWRLYFLVWASVLGISVGSSRAAVAKERLAISDNGRFLVFADGRPFFYLGDTAWELFHRLNREEATRYLEDRAAKGFTVIQAVAIAELDRHTVPNPYGHLPLVDLDPARPAVQDGPQNDYWDHVDFIVDKANDLGLHIGFLPTWGRYWHDTREGQRPIFDAANAEAYGKWLGQRYRDKDLIWILGGDRPIESQQQKEIIRAMARGLRDGDGGAHLQTFHPPGGNGSAMKSPPRLIEVTVPTPISPPPRHATDGPLGRSTRGYVRRGSFDAVGSATHGMVTQIRVLSHAPALTSASAGRT